MQFSALGRCCEARRGLFKCQEDRESSFHQWGGAVNVVQSCLSARKDRERTFHHCGGAVNLVKACLRARKDRGISFHH